jgi:hypothetical protein
MLLKLTDCIYFWLIKKLENLVNNLICPKINGYSALKIDKKCFKIHHQVYKKLHNFFLPRKN